MSCNQSDPYTLLVPWNATYNDVSDPLPWTIFVTMVSLAFTLSHFTFVYSSFKHVFWGSLTDPLNKTEWRVNIGFQFFFTLGFFALYLGAFIFYYQALWCMRAAPRDPQDTFSITMATMCVAVLASYQLARSLRQYHFTNFVQSDTWMRGITKRSTAIYFFSQVVPKSIFVAIIIFPSAYAYKVGASALFPINTGTFGPSIIFVFITGLLLAIAPQWAWMAFEKEDMDLAANQNVTGKDENNRLVYSNFKKHTSTNSAFHPLTSVYLLSDSTSLSEFQKPQLRRLVGEIEYMPIPTFWQITYLLYMYSYGIMIYNDPIKPVVFTFTCGIIPFALRLYSKHPGVFVPYHICMTFFFLCISYILEAIAPGPLASDTASATTWTRAKNWNLMTTGPYNTEVAAAGSTVQFFSFFSFAMAVVVFVSMWYQAINARAVMNAPSNL